MAASSVRGARHPTFIAGRVLEYRYFFLNLASSRRKELRVACGGWERCAANYYVDRSDFAFYGLEYVARGSGTLLLDGVENKLAPGSVFAYRPFTPHTIRTNPDDPLVKYFVDFSGQEAERIVDRKVLGARSVAYLPQSLQLHDLYEQMLATGVKGGRVAPRACSLLLELLSLRIEEDAHAPSELHGRARQTFERCRKELSRDFRVIRSISELADRTHVNAAYLARLFARFASEGPHEMLTRLKVNEGAAHLLGGGFTVKEIAAQIGFPDPYHFSRVFKKHHGISPTRFQRNRANIPTQSE